jgi:hypothetical protein
MKDVCFANLREPFGDVWEASDTSSILLQASVQWAQYPLSHHDSAVHQAVRTPFLSFPPSSNQMASSLIMRKPFFLCTWLKEEFVIEHYLL